MNAVDTNVLARFLLHDDAEQYRVAADVMRDGVFISLTVLLETAWLLASRFGLRPITVAAALRVVMSMPGTVVEGASLMAWAIDRFEAGADIADVVHLVANRDMTAFTTFDRAIERIAAGAPVPIVTLR